MEEPPPPSGRGRGHTPRSNPQHVSAPHKPKTKSYKQNSVSQESGKTHEAPDESTKPRPFFKPRHQQRTHHHHQPKQQSLSHLSPATTKAEDDDDLFGGKETCIVCCEEIEMIGIGPCGHKDVCHCCHMKQRILFDDKACCMCKAKSETIIITPPTEESYSVLSSKCFEKSDDMYFPNAQVKSEALSLLSLRCPSCYTSCKSGACMEEDVVVATSLINLGKHLKNDHNLKFCPICLEHRKVFMHEQIPYTFKELQKHLDEKSKCQLDDVTFKGHPMCQFCKTQFFDAEMLQAHLNKQHFNCYVCESSGVRNKFYRNASDLVSHQEHHHFVCQVEECIENPFEGVYKTKLELAAHMKRAHKVKMSQAGLAMEAGFTYQSARGGRNNRNRDASPEREEHIPEQLVSEPSGADFPEPVRKDVPTQPSAPQPSTTQHSAAEWNKRSMSEDQFPSLGGSSTPVQQQPSWLPERGSNDIRIAKARGKAKRRQKAMDRVPVLAPEPGFHSSSGIQLDTGFPSLGISEQPTQPRWTAPQPPTADYSRLTQPPQAPHQLEPKQQKSKSRKKTKKPQAEPAKCSSSVLTVPFIPKPSVPVPSIPDSLPPRTASPQTMTFQPPPSPQISKEELASRNREVMNRLRKQISHTQFQEFRSASHSFLKDEMSGESYYALYRTLSIPDETLFADLVSLLPNRAKRSALLSLHSNSTAKTSVKGGEVPPPRTPSPPAPAEPQSSASAWSSKPKLKASKPSFHTPQGALPLKSNDGAFRIVRRSGPRPLEAHDVPGHNSDYDADLQEALALSRAEAQSVDGGVSTKRRKKKGKKTGVQILDL